MQRQRYPSLAADLKDMYLNGGKKSMNTWRKFVDREPLVAVAFAAVFLGVGLVAVAPPLLYRNGYNVPNVYGKNLDPSRDHKVEYERDRWTRKVVRSPESE